MHDEWLDFIECANVEQQVDSLAGSLLAFGLLFGDALRAAAF
jgi:hypothetical protein